MIKKNLKFTLLALPISLSIASLSAQAGQIDILDENLVCPHNLATKAKLSYDSEKKEFTAFLDGIRQKINTYDVSGVPSNLSETQMEDFLKNDNIYFSLQKLGEDCSLKANVRARGGWKPFKKLKKGARKALKKIRKHTTVNVNVNVSEKKF